MTLASQDIEYLRAIVARNSGNELDASQDYLFESRLQSLSRAQGFASVDHLVTALRTSPGPALERSVAEAMTINETSFFREPAAFDLIREQLLPPLIERRRTGRALRFWSAACSSGQEAYSLAILLCEHFPQLASWSLDILGTDLASPMVERAQAGRYHRIEINRGLPARFLIKYMVRTGDEWEVNPKLARLCRFQLRNLCDAAALPQRCDVVLLRNVLFYFPLATRRRILTTIHRSLQPDGVLILGASERVPDDSPWEAIPTPKAICYRPLPAP